MTPSLFHDIQAAGIPYSSHESDLYIPSTPDAAAILIRHPLEYRNARRFIRQDEPFNGQIWFDVPFAYATFWEARRASVL